MVRGLWLESPEISWGMQKEQEKQKTQENAHAGK